ncbi:MAG: hypothetical protein ACQETE_06350 [Bacteroidota bacterium]
MNTSKLSRFITFPLLFVLEYLFKICSGVVAAIVLGARGSFFDKLGTGFGSLGNVIYKLLDWPERLEYFGAVINDYHTLTASRFHQQYGGQALDGLMDYLNEAVTYAQMVGQNLTQQPLGTLLATALAFLTFYFCARMCRFVRQRGTGSYLVRKEREWGARIFESVEE